MSQIPFQSQSSMSYSSLQTGPVERVGIRFTDLALHNEIQAILKKQHVMQLQIDDLILQNRKLSQALDVQVSILSDYLESIAKLNGELFAKLCAGGEAHPVNYSHVTAMPIRSPETGHTGQSPLRNSFSFGSMAHTERSTASVSISEPGFMSFSRPSIAAVAAAEEEIVSPKSKCRPKKRAKKQHSSSVDSNTSSLDSQINDLEAVEPGISSPEKKIKHFPLYNPSKVSDNIKDVVNEYLNGISGGPAIRDLEKVHGAKWRGGAHHPVSKRFGRMKPIYDAIEKGLEMKYSVEEIVDRLENAKVYYKDGSKAKRSMTWLKDNLPDDLWV